MGYLGQLSKTTTRDRRARRRQQIRRIRFDIARFFIITAFEQEKLKKLVAQKEFVERLIIITFEQKEFAERFHVITSAQKEFVERLLVVTFEQKELNFVLVGRSHVHYLFWL